MKLSNSQKNRLQKYANSIQYAMEMNGSGGRCGGLAIQWPDLIREAAKSGNFDDLLETATDQNRNDIKIKISSILHPKRKKK